VLPDTAPSGRDDVSAPYPARQNVQQSPRRYDPPETDASFPYPPSPFAAFTPPTPSFRSTSALPSSPPRPSPTATSARCVPRNSDIQRARLDDGITRSSGRADRPDLACLDPRVARIRRDSVGVHQTAKHSLYSSFSEQKIDLTRPLFNIAGEPRVRRLPRGPRVPVPLLRHLHSLRQRSRRQAPAFPDDWRLPGAGGCRRRREGG